MRSGRAIRNAASHGCGEQHAVRRNNHQMGGLHTVYRTILKQDAAQATKEKQCIGLLLKKANGLIERGKFYEAEQEITTALLSLNELKRMQDKKNGDSRLKALVEFLVSTGASAEVVRRVIHE